MPTKPTGRPRGRPPGAKNVPRIEDFIAETLASKVKPPEITRMKARGPWANMTPEERSEYARSLRARQKENFGGKPTGVPRSMSVAQYEALKAEQRPIVKRIMKKMADKGQLPEDPRAVEALEESLMVLRTAENQKTKLSAARLLLDFTKAKPTQKIEHTVKTAEDYLDELAEDDE